MVTCEGLDQHTKDSCLTKQRGKLIQTFIKSLLVSNLSLSNLDWSKMDFFKPKKTKILQVYTNTIDGNNVVGISLQISISWVKMNWDDDWTLGSSNIKMKWFMWQDYYYYLNLQILPHVPSTTSGLPYLHTRQNFLMWLYTPLISTKIGRTFVLVVGSYKVFEVSHVYKLYPDCVFFQKKSNQSGSKGSIEEEQG
jgi:hypothetical protein